MNALAERLVATDLAMLEVNEEISPNDVMYQGVPAHYFNVGVSALRAIGLALQAAGKTEVGRILDLPCGHGRVLRALKAAFPEAALTACDIDRDGVDFCAASLGARPVYSHKDPDELQLEGGYDLIWCGSLLTHVGFDYWSKFLRLFARSLAPDGVLVLTTAGRFASVILHSSLPLFDEVEGARAAGQEVDREREHTLKLSSYNLERDRVESVLGDYDRQGWGYVDYQGQVDYGISLARPSHVSALIEQVEGLQIKLYTERGWDDHQDVIACKRAFDTSPFAD
jgi:SAM-dependent methyltransferase